MRLHNKVNCAGKAGHNWHDDDFAIRLISCLVRHHQSVGSDPMLAVKRLKLGYCHAFIPFVLFRIHYLSLIQPYLNIVLLSRTIVPVCGASKILELFGHHFLSAAVDLNLVVAAQGRLLAALRVTAEAHRPLFVEEALHTAGGQTLSAREAIELGRLLLIIIDGHVLSPSTDQ